jgi:hypothetical protein
MIINNIHKKYTNTLPKKPKAKTTGLIEKRIVDNEDTLIGLEKPNIAK